MIVLEQMPGKISKILEHHIDSGQVGVVGAGSSKGVPYGGYGCRGRGGNSFDQRGDCHHCGGRVGGEIATTGKVGRRPSGTVTI